MRPYSSSQQKENFQKKHNWEYLPKGVLFPFIMGIEVTKGKLALFFFTILFGLLDIITTWFALNTNGYHEDNPLAANMMQIIGLRKTLFVILILTLSISSLSFLYCNYKPIDYVIKFSVLQWVFQKSWVVLSNLLVLEGYKSISLIHLIKMIH